MNTSHKSHPWIVFALLTAVTVVVVPLAPAPYSGPEVMFAAIGGVWALAFYLQQRHAEDTRFLKELLTDCNARYNELNDRLQTAVWSNSPFEDQARLAFIDYFNLCAEEWLFWRKGYIDRVVWDAWEAGMRQYSKDPRVAELWCVESNTKSYYGFELPM